MSKYSSAYWGTSFVKELTSLSLDKSKELESQSRETSVNVEIDGEDLSHTNPETPASS